MTFSQQIIINDFPCAKAVSKCVVRNRDKCYKGTQFCEAVWLRNSHWLGLKEALPAHPRQDVGCSERSLLSEPTWTQTPWMCASYDLCLFSMSMFGITHCTAPSWHHQVDKVKQNQRWENNDIFYRRK